MQMVWESSLSMGINYVQAMSLVSWTKSDDKVVTECWVKLATTMEFGILVYYFMTEYYGSVCYNYQQALLLVCV